MGAGTKSVQVRAIIHDSPPELLVGRATSTAAPNLEGARLKAEIRGRFDGGEFWGGINRFHPASSMKKPDLLLPSLMKENQI
jgi:hypothetical protein